MACMTALVMMSVTCLSVVVDTLTSQEPVLTTLLVLLFLAVTCPLYPPWAPAESPPSTGLLLLMKDLLADLLLLLLAMGMCRTGLFQVDSLFSPESMTVYFCMWVPISVQHKPHFSTLNFLSSNFGIILIAYIACPVNVCGNCTC